MTDHDFEGRPQVLVVGSGKGGVGKSVTAIGMAAAFAEQGHRVLLVDGDQNLGTLHVLLGVAPAYPLEALVDSTLAPESLLAEVAPNLWLLPSDSGSETLYGLGATDRARLHRRISGLFEHFDVTVIDAGNGLESAVRCATLRATRLVLVTTSEPAALTDAYALIKIVSLQVGGIPIDIVVNRTREEAEGRAAYERLAAAAERFLRRGVRYLGAAPEDSTMRDAIESPQALLAAEGPPALRAIRAIATSRIELHPILRLETADSRGESA